MSTHSHHRVHHDRRVHKNYGGLLIVWDRLFGSFVDECDNGDGSLHATGVGCDGVRDGDERVVYGVLVGPATWNPFTVQVKAGVAVFSDDHLSLVCRMCALAVPVFARSFTTPWTLLGGCGPRKVSSPSGMSCTRGQVCACACVVVCHMRRATVSGAIKKIGHFLRAFRWSPGMRPNMTRQHLPAMNPNVVRLRYVSEHSRATSVYVVTQLLACIALSSLSSGLVSGKEVSVGTACSNSTLFYCLVAVVFATITTLGCTLNGSAFGRVAETIRLVCADCCLL